MNNVIEVDDPPSNSVFKFDGPIDLTSLYPTDMDFLVRNCRKFDVAVHAGSLHWPKWLSIKFGTVYTFEPDLENFIYLMGEILKRPNVFAMRAMLGEHHGPVTYTRGSKDGQQIFTVPMFRIDDLALPHCDAIIVDEGMEQTVMRGAQRTIEKYAPQLLVGGNRIFNSREMLCKP